MKYKALFYLIIFYCGIVSNPQRSFGWPPRHLFKWRRWFAGL